MSGHANNPVLCPGGFNGAVDKVVAEVPDALRIGLWYKHILRTKHPVEGV